MTVRRLLAGGYPGTADPAPDGTPPSATAPSGLIAFTHDLDRATLTQDGPPLELASPSYLVQHPHREIVYAVGENEQPALFAISTDGAIDLVRALAIPGPYPCHLALTPDRRHVVVAGYGDGTVVAVGLSPDGVPTGVTGALTPTGTGPHPRQQAPHAHHVLAGPDATMWITDLGADRVRRVVVDAAGGLREVDPAIVLTAGTGPRQTRVSGDGRIAYVLAELSGEVLTAARGPAGKWTVIDAQPAAPGQPGGTNLPAHLVLGDGVLYSSNRGADCISVFDRTREIPYPMATIATGTWPRHFSVVDDWLYVADQYDDRISARPLPRRELPASSALALTLALRRPSCVIALR